MSSACLTGEFGTVLSILAMILLSAAGFSTSCAWITSAEHVKPNSFLAKLARSAANDANGDVPGRMAGRTSQSCSAAITGVKPACTSDDLPEPDGPTTKIIESSACSAGERN